MKTKSFTAYLQKRLDKNEINEIELQASLEYKALEILQSDVAHAITAYMDHEKIGFNELVRRLGISPTRVSAIQQGKANLTLASLAHIAALLKTKPRITFTATQNAR
jgi:transcriptional regulator with XRE-family HTH domain